MFEKISHNKTYAPGIRSDIIFRAESGFIQPDKMLTYFLGTIYKPSQAAQKLLFTPEQRQALLALPAKDLFLMLNYESYGTQRTLFSSMYDWLIFQDKDAGITQEEFIAAMQKSSSEKILQMVESFVNSPDCVDTFSVKEKTDIAASDEFKNEYRNFTEHLRPAKDGDNYYQLFKIFMENDFNKNRYLSALKTNDFKNFCAETNANYGIDPARDLTCALEAYLNPKSMYYLKSKNAAEAFAIIRKYFTGINFDSLNYVLKLRPFYNFSPEPLLRVVEKPKIEFIKEDFEKDIKTKSEYYHNLSKIYACEIKSAADLIAILMTDDQKLEKYTAPQARAIIDYLTENYPASAQARTLPEFLNYLDGILSCFDGLKISARELDDFLKLFNVDTAKALDSGFNGFTKITGEEIKNFAADGNFKNYAAGLFEQYPALDGKTLTEDDIEQITLSFRDKDKLEALNKLLKQKFTGFTMPEISAENHGAKMEILNFILQKGLNAIALNKNKSAFLFREDGGRAEYMSSEMLAKIISKFTDGRAEKLYNALTSDWGLRYLELNEFLKILLADKESFYIDKTNTDRYRTIKSNYNLMAERKSVHFKESDNGFINVKKEEKLTEIECLEDIESAQMNILLAKSDFLNNKTVKNYLYLYFPERVKFFAGRKVMTTDTLYELSAFAVLEKKEFPLIAETLKKEYGFTDENIKTALGYIPEDAARFLTEITGQKTITAFRELSGIYENSVLNKSDILTRAVKIKEFPEGANVLRALKKLRFDIAEFSVFDYITRIILTQKTVMQNLTDEHFVSFYQKTINAFYGSSAKIELIPEVSELYGKTGLGDKELMFSPDYGETVSYLRKKFFITDLHVSILLPILQIAKNLTGVRCLVEKLETRAQRVSANDLIFIARIARRPELQELLFNGEKMLDELRDVLNIAPSVRKKSDKLEYLESIKGGHNKDKIEADIQKERQEYTERPDITNFPLLQLLRLVLLKRGLEDGKFLESIGNMAALDRSDKKTEYGGIFTINEAGQLAIETVQSHSMYDGAYHNEKYKYFTGGAWTFHCHMQDDSYLYGGPSGWLGGPAGDIPYVENYDLTDVVMTAMGHPKDKDGKEDKTKILVDFDLYFVDKRDPRNPAARVFDMGTRVVDLPH